jgi:hypothetical protein
MGEDLHLQEKSPKINLGCMRRSPMIGHSSPEYPCRILEKRAQSGE